MTVALSKLRKTNQEHLERHVDQITVGINEIKDAIDDERNQRETKSEVNTSQITSALERLEEDILIESKVREETNQKLDLLIGEMEAKLKDQILVSDF